MKLNVVKPPPFDKSIFTNSQLNMKKLERNLTINLTTIKVIHSVYQCVIWAIWRWRNNVTNAPRELIQTVLSDSVFLLDL